MFRFKRRGSAAEMSHEWVPYVQSCGYESRSTVISARLKVLLITSRAVMKVNYGFVKNVTLSGNKRRRIWTVCPQQVGNVYWPH